MEWFLYRDDRNKPRIRIGKQITFRFDIPYASESWRDILALLEQAAVEIEAGGDTIPESLVKAYHMGKELAEKADNENPDQAKHAPHSPSDL